jgi:threonine dehydratase
MEETAADRLVAGMSDTLMAAWRSIREVLPRTPLFQDPALSACMGRPVYFKVETVQPPGSFKVRGAVARIAAIPESERDAGVIACSSGNHGKAVAWAAARLGIPAEICVPRWVDPVKKAGMESLGATVTLAGDTYDAAEAAALARAADTSATLVHPFDDPLVVAGQGTVALEILEACPGPLEALVPLSGGGLCGGMALAFRAAGGMGRVTAVSARNARVMRASLEAGAPVELAELPTLASALSGGIGQDNRVTFELIRTLVSRHLEVTEAEIARAMRYGYGELGLVLEGGGAAALAALLGEASSELAGEAESGSATSSAIPSSSREPLVVVLSGGNVDTALLSRVLAGEEA